MIIDKDGKITLIDENELYGLYLDRGYDDVMPFGEYKQGFTESGCEVMENKEGDKENG